MKLQEKKMRWGKRGRGERENEENGVVSWYFFPFLSTKQDRFEITFLEIILFLFLSFHSFHHNVSFVLGLIFNPLIPKL